MTFSSSRELGQSRWCDRLKSTRMREGDRDTLQAWVLEKPHKLTSGKRILLVALILNTRVCFYFHRFLQSWLADLRDVCFSHLRIPPCLSTLTFVDRKFTDFPSGFCMPTALVLLVTSMFHWSVTSIAFFSCPIRWTPFWSLNCSVRSP